MPQIEISELERRALLSMLEQHAGNARSLTYRNALADLMARLKLTK